MPEHIVTLRGNLAAKNILRGIFANIYIILFFVIISIGKKKIVRNFLPVSAPE